MGTTCQSPTDSQDSQPFRSWATRASACSTVSVLPRFGMGSTRLPPHCGHTAPAWASVTALLCPSSWLAGKTRRSLRRALWRCPRPTEWQHPAWPGRLPQA